MGKSIEVLGQPVFLGRECKERRIQLEFVKIKNWWRPALKIPQEDQNSPVVQSST